ncbi:MAG TPA: protein phosphatase 2C domain-containing protein [Streptosporangiaceae bacterium]|nr:protein phosphatase 2C domain-containing protein [Streptosporangiaceae bacterium]
MGSDKQHGPRSSRRSRPPDGVQTPPSPAPADDERAGQGGQAVPDNRSQWLPIVVDNKIEEFEPVPPDIRPYRPDTVCDGWSSEQMTVRMASVRGYLHRYNGTPRQDDADLGFDADTGAVVFAVADGLSSASHAHLGATAACRAAVEAILRDLGPAQAGPDWPGVMDAAASAVTARAGRHLGRPVSQDEVEDLMATTLVAGYLRPSDGGLAGSVAAVGDSSAWLHRAGSYKPVLAVKESENLVSSAVSPLPRTPESLDSVPVRLDADSVLLIGTDGFGDPLGDGDGMIGQLFTSYLVMPPPPDEFAHLLDFSRETFDDDRTLIAIWPRSGQPGRR